MKYFEFGQEHPELMVMPHGGVCYCGALPVAEEMAKTYGLSLIHIWNMAAAVSASVPVVDAPAMPIF